MDFSTKCNVLGSLWAFYRDDIEGSEAWQDFFNYNDVALPLAYMIDNGYATIIEHSEAPSFINETWEMFCEYINDCSFSSFKHIHIL